MSALDDLTRKLGLLSTAPKGTAQTWAQKTRALLKEGKTGDQAAMIAAKQVFPSEFDPTRYRSDGPSIEGLVDAIE
jgi:hypothetical protein